MMPGYTMPPFTYVYSFFHVSFVFFAISSAFSLFSSILVNYVSYLNFLKFMACPKHLPIFNGLGKIYRAVLKFIGVMYFESFFLVYYYLSKHTYILYSISLLRPIVVFHFLDFYAYKFSPIFECNLGIYY